MQHEELVLVIRLRIVKNDDGLGPVGLVVRAKMACLAAGLHRPAPLPGPQSLELPAPQAMEHGNGIGQRPTRYQTLPHSCRSSITDGRAHLPRGTKRRQYAELVVERLWQQRGLERSG